MLSPFFQARRGAWGRSFAQHAAAEVVGGGRKPSLQRYGLSLQLRGSASQCACDPLRGGSAVGLVGLRGPTRWLLVTHALCGLGSHEAGSSAFSIKVPWGAPEVKT